MNIDAKIYVAGHAGMVGSAVCRALQARGFQNLLTVPLERLDLRRQAEVEALFEAERPEVVFLAAARVGGILANASAPAEFLYDNLLIAANVIHAAWRSGSAKLINFGSSCIYPRLAPQPLREDCLLSGALEPTNEAYAVAKIAALKLCRHYNAQYGTDFFSLMPTNLYGPGDNYDLATSHVLPALLRKFHLARLLRDGDLAGLRRDLGRRPLSVARFFDGGTGGRGDGGQGIEHRTSNIEHRTSNAIRNPQSSASLEPRASSLGSPNSQLDELAAACAAFGITAEAVTLWGTGTPRREFLHVDDLAAAAVLLMEEHSWKDVGDFVNVGCGEDLPIRELAEMVRAEVGYAGEVRYDPSKPDGTPRKLLDVSRIRALGWAPRIPLRDGIARTYREYVESTGDR